MKKKSIIAVLIIILLLAYPFWRVHDAKSRVNRFSQRISAGTPVETVELLSRKLNLHTIKSDRSDSRMLIVWDGWAFAKWSCIVSIENNKVVSKELSFTD